jgi:hypothetical protein
MTSTPPCPWKDEDWFPERAYQEQLARTGRLYRRVLDRVVPIHRPDGQLTDINECIADYSDDVWSFFVNAWHIRDWVKHDKNIDSATRARIVDAAKIARSLRLCADLANGRKHLTLTRPPRIGAELSTMRAAIGEGENWIFDLYLTLGDEHPAESVAAVAVAFDAMREWQRIIEAEALPLPKGFPDLSIAPTVQGPICDSPVTTRGD